MTLQWTPESTKSIIIYSIDPIGLPRHLNIFLHFLKFPMISEDSLVSQYIHEDYLGFPVIYRGGDSRWRQRHWEHRGKGKSPSQKKGGEQSKSTQDGLWKSNLTIGNPYQIEDNKAPPSAVPQGGGASRRPLGICCLQFGKDFLVFFSSPSKSSLVMKSLG